jgi:peptidoglycan/LPS O-acetylase OafA/YrhL
MVVWFHASTYWAFDTANAAQNMWASLSRLGWVGVHIFFVISGYCITVRAQREREAKHWGGRFLLDRAWRIFPLFWAACALSFLLRIAATPFNHTPVFTPGQSFTGFLGEQLPGLFLVDGWFGTPPGLTVAWTLTCELMFYTLVALGLFITRSTGRVVLALALGFGLAGLAIFQPGFIWVNSPWLAPLIYWPEFLCGTLAGIALHHRLAARRAALVAIVSIGAAGVFAARAPASLPWTAGFACLLYSLHRWDERLSRGVWLQPLRVIGVAAFSLYLVHIAILSPLTNFIGRYLAPTFMGWPAISGAIVVFTCVAALGFHRWVEQPLERWRQSHRI